MGIVKVSRFIDRSLGKMYKHTLETINIIGLVAVVSLWLSRR